MRRLSKISLPDSTVIESELNGKTLLVYVFMLKSKGSAVGVRAIQRKLGFSSPSVALYHLEKLADLRLIEKNAVGEYNITREVKVGVLKFFTRLGSVLLPRYLFYSVWFTTMLTVYLVFYVHSWSLSEIMAVLFGSFASTIFWFETTKIWKERPF